MNQTWDYTTDIMTYTNRIEPTNAPWVTAVYSNVYNIDGNNVWGNTVATAYALAYTMEARTCYIQYIPTQESGYVDAFVEFADGQELFANRISTGRVRSHPHEGSGNTFQSPMSRVCVASGWDTAVNIWFEPQKGTFLLFGIGWKSEYRDIYDAAWGHSDNITGIRSTLSDERIKDNASMLDPSDCLRFCNSIDPSM